MRDDPTSQAFFEEKYRRDTDPWKFASSEYESSRYDTILSALSHRRYQHAFEPGCSVGVLTLRLASLCESIEALDISPTAVERARQRCLAFPAVDIRCAALPYEIPAGSFDLVVLSEIGYYFAELELNLLMEDVFRRMQVGGILLASHWLGRSSDHKLSGNRVHEIIGAVGGLRLEHSELHPNFRLDRWVRQ